MGRPANQSSFINRCESTMYPDRINIWPARGERGFSIVTAIFFIVVLSALSVFIVSVMGLRASSSELDVQGVRAYQAARAGVEWAAFQVLTPVANTPPGCPASPTHINTLAGSLAPFTATVECTASTTTTEGDRNIRTYKIISTACNEPSGASCPNASPSARYVQRKVEVVISRCNNPNAGPRFLC
jgi:MSHA biogenesis protein MshP